MSYEKNFILSCPEVRSIEEHLILQGFQAFNLVSEVNNENFKRIWELTTRNIYGLSWVSFRNHYSKSPKMLVIDIDAATPYEIRDSYIIDHNPYLFLEGALLIAMLFYIPEIYFVLRGEDKKVYERLNSALKDSKKYFQSLNSRILENRLVVVKSASERIFSNDNLLTSLCSGDTPTPMKITPEGNVTPLSIILDVETVSRLPGLMRAAIFENLKEFEQNFLVTIADDAISPGVYEINAGIEFSDVLIRKARGLKDNKRLKAVKIGGIFSPMLTAAESMKLNLDIENYKGKYSDFKTPTIILLSEDSSVLANLIETLNFFVKTACGYCIFGRESLRIFILELSKIKDGSSKNLSNLIKIADALGGNGYCNFPQPISRLIKSCVENFPEEFC